MNISACIGFLFINYSMLYRLGQISTKKIITIY